MEPVCTCYETPDGETDVRSDSCPLVHLHASQINGCSFCVDSGARGAKKAGETDERLFTVAAWREAPQYHLERCKQGQRPFRPVVPCVDPGSPACVPHTHLKPL
jgi:AhpD family alkylhydroperoxidase